MSSTSDLVLFKQGQEQRHNITITDVVRNIDVTCSVEHSCSYTSGIHEQVYRNVRHQNRSTISFKSRDLHKLTYEGQAGEDISHNRKCRKEAYS